MKATVYYIRTQKTIEIENVVNVSFLNQELTLDLADGSWKVFPRDVEVLIDIKEK